MDNKELRKFSKKEILEILLSQAKRIEELEEELSKTKKKLDSKKIAIEDSGSLAEASLKLNNIFEVAQTTAEQYLFNVKEKCKKLELDTKKEINKMLEDTEEICKKKKESADAYLTKIKNTSKKSNKSTVLNKNNKSKTNNSKNNKKVKLEKMKKEI